MGESCFFVKESEEWCIRKTYPQDNPLNPSPKYDFDSAFYKFPSYLRRAAIQSAVGSYSSYQSALSNWEKSDQSTKKPKLSTNRNIMPVFYKKNTYNRLNDYSAEIKIYHQKDWVWAPVTFRKSDVDYIKHHCADMKEGSPVLENKRVSHPLCDFLMKNQ